MKVIERNNQRVVLSTDLAEAFGADIGKINYNYNYNKNRYEEGKHYFVLRGDELRDFKTDCEIHASLKKTHTLYLWTEKGAFLHAKSLNTDKAWNAYGQLVDDYFKKVEQSNKVQPDIYALSPQLQFMIITEQRQNELESRQTELQAENEELRKDMKHLSLVVDNEVWITEHQKSDIRDAVKSRVGKLKSQTIDAHFQGCYGDLNTFFSVSKYDKIARKDFEQAIDFIQGWFPKKKENLS